MSIKTIDQLRDFALKSLDDLARGKIEIDEAGARSKLCENVVSATKLQLIYANMLGREPNIKFLGNCTGAKMISRIPKSLPGV